MHLVRLLVQYPQSTRVSPCIDRPAHAVRRHEPAASALIVVFVVLFLALLASPIYAAPAGSDPERTATDPNAARAAKLQSASDSLNALHFTQAIDYAREVRATAKDSGEITRAEEIILDATRYRSGCKTALDEAKRMLSEARHLRPDNRDEISMIEKRMAELQDEVEAYSKALEAQKEIVRTRPGTAQALDAAYRIARLMCYYGSQDEAVYALRQLIRESGKSERQIADRDGSAVVGEAVATLKKLCLTRSGPDEAVRQLKEVAASHILDEAGAHAWNSIGDVYRSQGKTDLAEQAYLTVDRMYSSSPVRYTAMMSAGDMWVAMATVYEARRDYPDAILFWKKALLCYPDDRRKYETAHVIGYFLMYGGKYRESHKYFRLVLDNAPMHLMGLRDDAQFYDMRAYYWAEDYEKALYVAKQILRDSNSPKYREEAQIVINNIKNQAHQ